VRVLLPALFLAASFGGPHGGCDCGHTASAHGGNVSHGSFSNAHFPASSSVSHASSGGTVTQAAPAAHPHFAVALANGIRHALAAGARAIEAALGLDIATDEPPVAEPAPEATACRTADDCGEGELGQGTVCDHWSEEPRALGVCRDACRSDDDCPAPMECHWDLDPAGPSCGGCVE
jgi:hypothetical protein